VCVWGVNLSSLHGMHALVLLHPWISVPPPLTLLPVSLSADVCLHTHLERVEKGARIRRCRAADRACLPMGVLARRGGLAAPMRSHDARGMAERVPHSRKNGSPARTIARTAPANPETFLFKLKQTNLV
jgi:hypothetical protein